MTHVGRSVRRVEDARLLRGAGRFVDDVDRPGQLWMRVVRSPSAHARLVAVETAAARASRTTSSASSSTATSSAASSATYGSPATTAATGSPT